MGGASEGPGRALRAPAVGPTGSSARHRRVCCSLCATGGPEVFVAATDRVEREGFTVHGSRHTAASLAAPAGARVRHLQVLLGHTSPALELSTCQHPFDDDVGAVTDRLDPDAEATWKARAGRVRTEATVTGAGRPEKPLRGGWAPRGSNPEPAD
ncbi:hypothetical protein GCM10009528_15200 [Kineococcus aurantiacus]